MLLGTNGVCVISHGSSNATAMMNAVLVAHECATRGLVDQVAAAVRPVEGLAEGGEGPKAPEPQTGPPEVRPPGPRGGYGPESGFSGIIKGQLRRGNGHSTVDTTLVGVPAETHTNQGPLDRNGVFELIRDQLADILEMDPSSITEGASFVEDLDADSLALIELVEALEEELGERTVGFRIDDEDLEDLRTVRDAVDYVYAKLEKG